MLLTKSVIIIPFQVHKAYMRADMIPDEALVDDIIEDADEEPEIDFADGTFSLTSSIILITCSMHIP